MHIFSHLRSQPRKRFHWHWPGSLTMMRHTGIVLSWIITPVGMLGGRRMAQQVQSAPWDRSERWMQLSLLAILTLVGYGAYWWYWYTMSPRQLLAETIIALIHGQLLHVLLTLCLLWLINTLLGPLIAIGILVTNHSRQQRQQAPKKKTRTQIPWVSPFTSTTASSVTAPHEIEGSMVIGKAMQGDLATWRREQWLLYPQSALNTHGIVIGRSGAGKSETLLRIAVLAASIYKLKVIFIDGKGDWEMMARFTSHMHDIGLEHVGLFPVEKHNGWLGNRQDMLNRLLESQSFSEDYYRGIATNMLSMAIHAPGKQAPTTSTELLHRLNLTNLKKLYKGHPQFQELQALKSEAAWGVYYRYASFFRAIDGKLDGAAGYGQWDAAYYLLDGVRLEDESARLGQYLIKDFEQYMAIRKTMKAERRVLFILDEFSAISGRANATNLFERIRSLGGSVLVSSQSYEGLGQYSDRMLATASTLILHSSVLPAQLIEAAGRLWTTDYSVMLHDTNQTKQDTHAITRRTEQQQQNHSTLQNVLADQSSTQEQQEDPNITIHQRQDYRVQPSDVQQLPIGEAYVIHGGKAQRIAVAMLDHDTKEIQRLEDRLYQLYQQQQQQEYDGSPSHFTPPSSSTRTPMGPQPSTTQLPQVPIIQRETAEHRDIPLETTIITTNEATPIVQAYTEIPRTPTVREPEERHHVDTSWQEILNRNFNKVAQDDTNAE